MIPNFTANLIYLMMHSIIVLSKPMLDNGDEFLSPDMKQQNSNASLGSDHLSSSKSIPHVMRCIKISVKLNQNFRVISKHYHRQ